MDLLKNVLGLGGSLAGELKKRAVDAAKASIPAYGLAEGIFSPKPSTAVGQYIRGQVVDPIKQGARTIATNPDWGEKAVGAAQIAGGVYGATPAGMATNLVSGTAAGVARSTRTGQDLGKSVQQAAYTPTSFASQGLGIENPLLALGVDIIALNPKQALKGGKTLKALLTGIKDERTIAQIVKSGQALGIKGINPRAMQPMLRQDKQEIEAAIDFIRSGVRSGTAYKEAVLTVQRALEHLAPGYKYANNRKAIQALEWILDVQDQVPKGQRVKLPKMGLVEEGKGTPAKPLTPPETPAMKPGVVRKNPTEPFYNVKRIKTGNQQGLRQTVQTEAKPLIEKTVGKTLSHEEVSKLAEATSDELIKTVGRKTTAELGAAQLRLREKIAQMADQGTVSKEMLESLVADKSFSASTARLLGQRAINAAPQTPIGKLKATYLKNILAVEEDLDKVLAAAKNVNWEDPASTTAFYRQFITPKLGDWADKLRYNSMLSSPITQIVNIASNVEGSGLLTPVQKTVEGVVDALASGITGRARTRFAGEGAAYAKGYATSVKQAWGNLLGVFKGSQLIENPDTRNIPLTTSAAGRAVETALDVPTKALEAFDQFFMTLTKGGLEASSKYRLAKGGKAAGDVSKKAQKLLFRGDLTEEGAGVISNAIGAGGEWVKRGANSSNKPVRWLAKLTLPFVNIGTNLAKTGAEYNPVLGSLNLIGNADKTAQVSKIAIGGVVTLIGAGLALDDKLTFGEPTSQKEKNAYRAAGLQPYSIKIGDTWYQYSKMHPAIAFQLATVAAMTQAWKEGRLKEDAGERLANGAWTGLKFIADQTYFKNVGDFVNTASGDVEGLSRLASNYPSQFIPFRALTSWVNRMVDQYQRKPDTSADFATQSFQQIAMQIPGLSGMVPPRLGPDGQPIEQPNRLVNAVSPVKVSTERPEGKQVYDLFKTEQRLKRDNADLSAMAEDGQGNVAGVGAGTSGAGSDVKGDYQDSIARERAKQSREVQVGASKAFYQVDGTVKSVPLDRKIEAPTLSGQPTLDKLKLKDYQSDLSAKMRDVATLADLGLLKPEEAEKTLTKLQQIKDQVSGAAGKKAKAHIKKIATTAAQEFTKLNTLIARSRRQTRTTVPKRLKVTAPKLTAQKLTSRADLVGPTLDIKKLLAGARTKTRRGVSRA